MTHKDILGWMIIIGFCLHMSGIILKNTQLSLFGISFWMLVGMTIK